MNISLDRRLPVPVQVQLKGQIEYGIMSGVLSAGTQLPSIRELAETHGLAPATVSQVYRELQREGLLVSRAGLGTFVADLGISDDRITSVQMRSQELRRIIDRAIDEALSLGFTTTEINNMLASRLGHFQQPRPDRPHIALVGIFERATRLYARDIERNLKDLHVGVECFILEELRRDPDAALGRMEGIHLVVTPAHRIQEVRELLEPAGKEVIDVIFVLSEVARERFLGLTPGSRLAVVSTFPEFLSTMLQGIECYHQFDTEPQCAVIDDAVTLQEALRQAEAVIYATGSEAVLDMIPPEMEAIEYLHAPDPVSVERLRPLIVALDGAS
jgi:DNA-binding transcriptional regulator YhcF (GntR family)